MTTLINSSPVVAVDGSTYRTADGSEYEYDPAHVIATLIRQIGEQEDELSRLRAIVARQEDLFEAAVESKVARESLRLNGQMAALRRKNAGLRARLARFEGEGA